MKKILMLAVLGLMLAVAGCSSEKAEGDADAASVAEGEYRIDIYTADNTEVPVNTIDDAATVEKLLESPEWERITDVPQDMVPEYGIVIWKKVELNYDAKESSAEPEYEVIETITTFKDTDCIEKVYSQNAMKGTSIPVGVAAFYYKVPQEFLDTVKKLAE